MSIFEGTTNYNLKRKLMYAVRGEQVHAEFLELREPGMEHVTEYTNLKQMIGRAQMELAGKSGQFQQAMESMPQAGEEVKKFADQAKTIEDEAGDMGDMINLAIMSSATVDAAEFIKTFQKMACKTIGKSICSVDGKQAMTPGIWSGLHPDEAFDIAVRWCAFFATALGGAEKNTSGQRQESDMEVTAV